MEKFFEDPKLNRTGGNGSNHQVQRFCDFKFVPMMCGSALKKGVQAGRGCSLFFPFQSGCVPPVKEPILRQTKEIRTA